MNRDSVKELGHRRRRPMNHRVWALCCALLVLSCLVPMAIGQETTAGLQGVVKDPTGAVVPNATVELSGPALMTPKKQQTDGTGAYHFASLPPGVYTLSVTAAKFRT